MVGGASEGSERRHDPCVFPDAELAEALSLSKARRPEPHQPIVYQPLRPNNTLETLQSHQNAFHYRPPCRVRQSQPRAKRRVLLMAAPASVKDGNHTC